MSNYLYGLLKEKNMSQVEFGRRLGLCKSNITHYINGKIKLRKLPIDRIYEMSIVLDVPIAEFVSKIMEE